MGARTHAHIRGNKQGGFDALKFRGEQMIAAVQKPVLMLTRKNRYKRGWRTGLMIERGRSGQLDPDPQGGDSNFDRSLPAGEEVIQKKVRF